MGIFSFSETPARSGLTAAVQAVAAWWLPAQNTLNQYCAAAGHRPAPGQLALPFGSASPSMRLHLVSAKAGKTGSRISPSHRLKVVREFDSAISPACTGRMVLSGRMADVCAELDRMAQRETAAR